MNPNQLSETELLSELKRTLIDSLGEALDIGKGEADKIVNAIAPDLLEALRAGDTKLSAELQAQIKASALAAHRKLTELKLRALQGVVSFGLGLVGFKLGHLLEVLTSAVGIISSPSAPKAFGTTGSPPPLMVHQEPTGLGAPSVVMATIS